MSTRDGGPKARVQVPYSSLPLEGKVKVTLVNGEVYSFNDGRRVEVYRGLGKDGIYVRIYCPIGKRKESVLKFRVSDEAANALAYLLARKMNRKAIADAMLAEKEDA